MFTSVLGRYFAPTILLVGYPNLSGVADSVGGQLRGDKLCPFSGVTDSGSLEEGAGEQCSECVHTELSHTVLLWPRVGVCSKDVWRIQRSVIVV